MYAEINSGRIIVPELSLSLRELFLRVAVVHHNSTIRERFDYTNGHGLRVSKLARDLGRAVGLSGYELIVVYLAGKIHDAGKLGIEDNILLNPGKLSIEEYEAMKTHTLIGENIARKARLGQGIKEAIRSHHEWWNGDPRGYPDGLKGEKIPLAAQIIAVADAYDAITQERPYDIARSPEEALVRMKGDWGRQFAPQLQKPFEELIQGKFLEKEVGH